MTTKERMHSQKVYFCDDEDLVREQEQCLEILYDFNHTRPSEKEKRQEILKSLVAELGENCYIEPLYMLTGEDIRILAIMFMLILI